jgi:UDP-2,4-diacetamido-2,4,6-trideoxy-beta-L-altropyranose hydrolase
VIDKANWLIVDHYAFYARWEGGLAKSIGQIVAIDELADRKHVTALLRYQNLGRDANDFKGLVPDTCHLMTKPQIAFLRPNLPLGAQLRSQGARMLFSGI